MNYTFSNIQKASENRKKLYKIITQLKISPITVYTIIKLYKNFFCRMMSLSYLKPVNMNLKQLK